MKFNRIVALITLSLMTSAAWAGEFRENHPRRAEVNRRVKRQDRRIKQGVKDGTLTKAQAKDLRQEDREVKTQERQDVKANGGYLTADQKKQLNGELNQNSKQIHDEKHE